ncbi:MAG: ATP-binding protein [Gemmatimonadetes bacterium]|nr:ATP-binding protein [Gemmatimonadota bacterium]
MIAFIRRLFGARAARWGWLLTTFALAVALLVTQWIHYRGTAGAALTLSRGQGEDLLEHARQGLRDRSRDALPVDSIFRAHEAEGLRYLGVIADGDRVLAEAGDPLGPRTGRMIGRADEIVEIGDRFRHFGMVPGDRGPGRGTPPPRPDTPSDPTREGEPPRPPAAGAARADAGTRQERPPQRPVMIVIEYVPVLAQELAADSRRAFILSTIVIFVLLGVALGYFRLSARHDAARQRLEQQERLGMLGEMSAVLAHEIRNPLASLKGHAQLLAERPALEEPDRRKAERIVREAERLEALTSDLLDFSRSGPIDVRAASPVAVVEASVQDVDPEGFAVDASTAPETWPLDAGRMRQALTNLLRNARQATPPEARAEISVTQENGALVFAVRDFGAGIRAGDEKRIFSPFFTTRTSGTGLGLAVARRVAEMHQGTISASNHPRGGALFRITIPRG